MLFTTLAHVLVLVCVYVSADFIQTFKIGAIFDISEINEEHMFKTAIKMANDKYKKSLSLSPITIFVQHTNAMNVSKAACKLLQESVVGIFGPSSPTTSRYVQSLCDNKELPLIEAHWDRSEQKSLVNLYPSPSVLAKVYMDVIKLWQWKKFTILYENDDSLPKIGDLLLYDNQAYAITLRLIEFDASLSYRSLLNVIKAKGETNFLIDCNTTVLEELLKQAQQVGLITEKYNYLITNLDMHTIDLAPFQYGGANITGVRMVNPENRFTIEVAAFFEKLKSGHIKIPNHIAAWKINLKSALIFDAIFLFMEALEDVSKNRIDFNAKALFCDANNSWNEGYTIINNMKTRNLEGLTGLVKFDTQGFRSDFRLEIVELAAGGLTKVGNWNSTQGINILRKYHKEEYFLEYETSLVNKSFTVITALTPPYGMLKKSTTKLSDNDRFEGFGIDLIRELSEMLGFNYTFIIQEDGANGNYNKRTKTWNGMIREIIDERADLAITDLTITSERENAVDFTMPFMNLGISILYKKPEPVAPSLFTFASPFSIQLWLLLGVAYFLVSICLFLIGRLCPYEWINPLPCVEKPDHLVNQFTLRNSLWFTIGSLMQQGTEIAPVGISTRMVAGVWWFFTLIMVSSYTANLAAFLTVETLVTSFKNINDLARQNEIRYGAKADGATSNFFREDSDIETYKTIAKRIRRHPEDMTADNDEGVLKVENENYAFLMESTTIEYVVERHCSLAQVGGLLDDKGYGIAMRKDSLYRNILSAAVVKLQENGRISALKIKWWKERHGGGNCISNRAGQATALDLQNVEGVFLILVLGAILGLLGTFIELAVHVYRRKRKEKFKEAYVKELKFILKFNNEKPVEENRENSTNNLVTAQTVEIG